MVTKFSIPTLFEKISNIERLGTLTEQWKTWKMGIVTDILAICLAVGLALAYGPAIPFVHDQVKPIASDLPILHILGLVFALLSGVPLVILLLYFGLHFLICVMRILTAYGVCLAVGFAIILAAALLKLLAFTFQVASMISPVREFCADAAKTLSDSSAKCLLRLIASPV